MPVPQRHVSPLLGALLERMQEAEEMEEEYPSLKAEDAVTEKEDVKIDKNTIQNGCEEEAEEVKMKWFQKPLALAIFGPILTLIGFVLLNIFTPIGNVNSESIEEIKGAIKTIEERVYDINGSMVTKEELSVNTQIILEAINNIGD